MLAFTVNLLQRNGEHETNRFFSLDKAQNFYNLSKGNGCFVGGTICTNEDRIGDFGILKDGFTLAKARKILRNNS